MSPNHRAEPGATEAAAAVDTPAAPAASAAPTAVDVPVAPDELDVLVDRLADEQATTAEEEARATTAAGRPEPPPVAEEMDTLQGFLDFLRATIAWKVEGLSDEQAAARMVGSATTVTGLVRHLADTERYWFLEVVAAVPPEEVDYTWSDGPEPSRAWEVADGASLAEALADYECVTRFSRAQLHGREGEEEVRGGPEMVTVRWVLTHMVEETARHVGQLDVLAELLDGRTGE